MKKIKKIAGTAVFLTIAAGLLMAVSYLVRPVNNEFLFRGMEGIYREEKDSIDVTFFGSSALYRFINVSRLWDRYGFTAYNIGSPSQPVESLKYLMDEVEKEQSPQLYVVECRRYLNNRMILSEREIRYAADTMKYSLNRFKMINDLAAGEEDKLVYHFDLIKYHDNWERLKEKSWDRILGKLTFRRKGWVEISDVAEGLEKPGLVAEDEMQPISEQAEEELRELIQLCQEEGREVLFLATPFVISEDEQKQYHYIRDIVEESGYRFLDCNQFTDEIGLDFSVDYYDSKHTNSLGAEKVTAFVGNYIMENYSIDTQHTDSVKESWNKAAERGRKTFEKAKKKILKQAGAAQ